MSDASGQTVDVLKGIAAGWEGMYCTDSLSTVHSSLTLSLLNETVWNPHWWKMKQNIIQRWLSCLKTTDWNPLWLRGFLNFVKTVPAKEYHDVKQTANVWINLCFFILWNTWNQSTGLSLVTERNASSSHAGHRPYFNHVVEDKEPSPLSWK